MAGDGACFPIHVDSEESIDGRRLTAVLYLNPGWEESRGGQLRLYPVGMDPVDIAPLHDRLVVFESHRLLHRRVLTTPGIGYRVWGTHCPYAVKHRLWVEFIMHALHCGRLPFVPF